MWEKRKMLKLSLSGERSFMGETVVRGARKSEKLTDVGV